MRIVVVRTASAAASVQPSKVSWSAAAGAARWSISQTESKPAASAARVRSRIVGNDIRSCGRNRPNQGATSVAAGCEELVDLRLEPVEVAARRVLVLVVELHDDCAAGVD